MKATVGIDIDGVLADLISGMGPILREEYGIVVENDDCIRWNYLADRIGGVGPMLQVMDRAWAIGEIPLMEEGLAATLRRLKSKKFNRMIISARTNPSHPYVVKWLHACGLEYESLVLIGLNDHSVSKFDYPLDILVDDRPSMVEEARAFPYKRLYLYDQPWNRDAVIDPERNGNVRRVKSLSEAVDRITEGVYA